MTVRTRMNGTRPAGRRPTITDVARAAGVSTSTVSRYLTRGGYVSGTAEEAIRRAISELGYVRNMAASSLMTQSTHTVAFVLHEPDMTFFKDPNISAMMLGAVRVLRPAGIQVVMIASDTADDIRLAGEYLLGGHVDGAMLVSGRSDDPLLEALAQSALPHITAGRPAGAFRPAFVDTDNYGATREITSRLIATGRRRLVHVAGPQSIESARSRLGGFLSAVAEHGVDGRVFAADEFGFDGGVRAVATVGESGVDGFVAASDALAAGVVAELERRGVGVPDDVGVVGFDDNDWATRSDPQLTTVRQDAESIGSTMARYLLSRFTGEGDVGEITVLPYEIVWRDSAGPAPA